MCTQDFLYYLEQHNYKFNDEIIRRFIKHYDKNGNFNLTYSDFLKFISPSGFNLDNSKKFEDNIDEYFCNIIIKELKLIGFIDEMILQFRKNKDFDSHKLFIEISRNDKYLNKEILNTFLEGKFSDIEINRLIYFIDTNNQGIISYEDFLDLLIPIKSDYEFEEDNDNIYLNDKYLIKNDSKKKI